MGRPNSQTWLPGVLSSDTSVCKKTSRKVQSWAEGSGGQATIIKSYLARVDYTARAKPCAWTHRQAALHLVRFNPHDAASVPTGDR
jgi:hypothetical protein